ncbi:MAG: hypothetical protein ACF8TS_20660 [Maioricimonas sp. JB049]
MCYDHHKKSGNRGDVVKHVALWAALDGCLRSFSGDTFRYADTFAGYAWNPLVDRPGNEWKQGIGSLVQHGDSFRENGVVDAWARRYLSWQDGEERRYPGSAVIARDLFKDHDVKYQMSLWDIADAPVASLKEEFQETARVYQHPATLGERDVQEADFLFIDPPGLKTRSRPEYPAWQDIQTFLQSRDSNRPLMMWLPIKAVTRFSPPKEDALSLSVRDEIIDLGFSVVKVRYRRGGTTIGCQIVHNFSCNIANEIPQAISSVVDIAGWKDEIGHDLKAVVTY